MRLAQVRIQNLRAFSDETVRFDSYTAMVGANGAGKSTVLCALNIFFRNSEGAATNITELDEEDFHLRDTSKPIEITVSFEGLTDDEKSEFSDYYRHDALIISAVATFDATTGKAVVDQFGQRRGMDAFRHFFGYLSSGKESAEQLRERFAALRELLPGIRPEKTKDGMKQALIDYEADHEEQLINIPSKDQFYGFSKGINRLERAIQWIYVPAVKDASEEQLEARNTALGRLLARTVRSKVNFSDDLSALRKEMQERYQALLCNHQDALEDINSGIQSRIAQWAHPDVTVQLAWHQDARKSVQIEEPIAKMLAGEGDFLGEIARLGHGLQRSYLLALLQELAETEAEKAPRLVLGIEEPELYQHPPQARHLNSILQGLATSGSQIIVSTHSPHFVGGQGFESVRLVRRKAADRMSVIRAASADDVIARISHAKAEPFQLMSAALARLNQILLPSLNEMFFTPKLVLVEGLEDVAYIASWLHLSGKRDRMRKAGVHVVPVGGKSELLQPLAVAQSLEIPTFVVFDSDGSERHEQKRPRHLTDNTALLRLLGADDAKAFPAEMVLTNGYCQWVNTLGDAVAEDFGAEDWMRWGDLASAEFGHPKGFAKNQMHIASRLSHAALEMRTSERLDALCDAILAL